MTVEPLPLPSNLSPNERLLTLPKVKERVPMSTATIYRWMKRGNFPRNFKISPQTVVWLQSDINRWIEQKTSMPG